MAGMLRLWSTLALVLASTGAASQDVTADPNRNTIMLGAIDASIDRYSKSVEGLCYRDKSCEEAQWQAYGRIIEGYRNARPKQQARIVAELTAEKRGDQINWRRALDGIPLSALMGPIQPLPPGGLFRSELGTRCDTHVSKNGRHASTYCW